jgi:hypothetical protein
MTMKRSLRIHSEHSSYLKHRRQMWTQIVLPVVLAALLALGLAGLAGAAAVGGSTDTGRWAAISTMWLVLPFAVLGILLIILLAGLSYLAASLRKLIPPYSSQVQRFFFRIEAGARRAAEMTVRPVLLLQEAAARARTLMRRR